MEPKVKRVIEVLLFVIIAGAMIVNVTSCKTMQDRRLEYIQNHDTEYSQAIFNGSLRKGMSKSDVEASIGPPNSMYRTSDGYTAWTYDQINGEMTLIFQNDKLKKITQYKY